MRLETIIFRRQKVRKWRDISVLRNPRCLKKSNMDKIVHWVKLCLNFLKFFTMGTTQMLCHGLGFISAVGLLKKCSREFDVAFQILKNMEFVSI